MKLLFVASECAPFVKTGGLADVIGAVPKALAAMGAEVRVMLPAYPALSDVMKTGSEVASYPDLPGGTARLIAASAEGLDLLLLDAPYLFDRPGSIYLDQNGHDQWDNHIRFGALAAAGARVALDGVDGWMPDLVNAHDWQAGLVPAYLKQSGRKAPPVVTTIHNIAFQGLFGPEVMHPLGLDAGMYHADGLEFFGRVGFLKAGLVYSDAITTVSPTYSRELLTPEFGMGLEGVLAARQARLTGILNGIDLETWNPEADAALAQTYSARTLARKAQNKAELQSRFALSSDSEGPLFCVISRLTGQKGLDMLLDCLPGLVARGAQLALVGSGDADLERGFIDASVRFQGQVGTVIGYDEKLSHKLQGGSDAILIPSRFEPCGLTQLYGLRYGTLPVVARTGGLADTVIDANEAALQVGCATGIQFSPVTPEGLDQAIARTCDLFAQPKVWAGMQRQAMKHPVGWDKSARAYMELFTHLIESAK